MSVFCGVTLSAAISEEDAGDDIEGKLWEPFVPARVIVARDVKYQQSKHSQDIR